MSETFRQFATTNCGADSNPHTINLPTGYQSGDWLVVVVGSANTSTVPTPTNWTLYNSFGLHHLTVFTRKATGDSNDTCVVTNNGDDMIAISTAIIGGGAIDAANSANSAVAPSLNPTASGEIYMGFWFAFGQIITPPVSLTAMANIASGSIDGASLNGGYKTAGSGATGTFTATGTGIVLALSLLILAAVPPASGVNLGAILEGAGIL